MASSKNKNLKLMAISLSATILLNLLSPPIASAMEFANEESGEDILLENTIEESSESNEESLNEEISDILDDLTVESSTEVDDEDLEIEDSEISSEISNDDEIENSITDDILENSIDTNEEISTYESMSTYSNDVIAGGFTITGGVLGTDFSYSNGVLTILSSTILTIKNTDQSVATTDRILIPNAVEAHLVLDGVNILSEYSPITLTPSTNSDAAIAHITIADNTKTTCMLTMIFVECIQVSEREKLLH